MSTLFAPWVEGSAAPDFSQTSTDTKVPHLRLVPSAPEYEDDDYEIEEVEKDYEGVLLFTIKALLVLILFSCVALAGLGIGFALRDTPEAVTVQAGDSLYSIGARVPNAPSAAQAADDIRSLNALDSDNLQIGQTLIIPEY